MLPLVHKFVGRGDNVTDFSVVGDQADLHTCSGVAIAELCQPHLLGLPHWLIRAQHVNRFEREHEVTTVLATDFTQNLVRDRHILTAHTKAATSLVAELVTSDLELHSVVAF